MYANIASEQMEQTSCFLHLQINILQTLSWGCQIHIRTTSNLYKNSFFLIVAFQLKMRNYTEQNSLMMRLQFPGVFIFLFFPSNVFLRCFFPMYFSDVFLKWWDCSFLAFSFLCYSAASPPMYFQFDLTRRESHRLKFQTTKFPQEICFPPKATRLSLDLTGSKLKGCVYWVWDGKGPKCEEVMFEILSLKWRLLRLELYC